jgi:uncharacterized protein (DUF58 family)
MTRVAVKTKPPVDASSKSERRLKARLLPVLVGLCGLLYVLTGFHGWLAFLIGSGGAWLLAFVWVHSLERGLSIERKIHYAWAHVGESVPEELIVVNRSWLPVVWVEIMDEADRLVEPIRLVSDVEAHSSRRRHPIHRFKRRGQYTLGPTRLRTGDPFGIYTLTLYDRHASTILVTPPQLPLAQLHIAPGGWAGDRQRRRQSLEREISDAGVREYSPGDSLRRIHWHASAHNDTLIVRQLEAATSGDWWIFVDLQAQAQAGSGQDSTLELSIVLAASLVARGLRERRRVGLALVGPGLVWLEPRSDLAHRWQLLYALSVAGPGDRSLAELLTLGRPAKTATLIAVTPTAETAWVAAAAGNLQGGKMTALLVDPGEFGSHSDQAKVSTALTRSGIPHIRMPRALLDEAYASPGWGRQRRPGSAETGRRYLEKGRAAWQSMD